MPIKNLDDSLFAEKPETNKAKPKPELNFSADNTSEIYNEINKFMADMPQDMLDKFKDFSDNLSSKLEDVNLADLFNVEVNKVEIKSPVVTKLFQAIARFNETELKDEKIVNKISELTNYLNDYKNGNLASPKEEIKEEIKAPTADEYIAKVKAFKDPLLELLVNEFIPADFIKAYNFVDNGSNYVTEDLSNLVLTNPLTNEKLDLSNAKLVYGNQETRTNSVLADRVLLYLDKNDTSTYIILFAYNDEGNYKFYIPKFANYALLNIKDKVVLHNVRQAFFKYKNVKACLEQIETIFVLKKTNLQYPLLTLGQVLKNDPYYMGDSLINIGFFSFADGSQSFRQKFDISDMTISFYLKIKADLSEEKTNYLVQELKNFDFTKSVLNNYELKYNNLKNYLYIEL